MRGTVLVLVCLCQSLFADANLPPVGRSAFDLLIQRNGGRLPTTMTELVATMERLGGSRVKTVMQPDSRSSQRGLADDAHPRILGVGGEVPQSRRARTLEEAALRPPTDRIFFAFSERARTVEVLSYNARAARNEFQLITEFGTPEARLVYARRMRCLGCHLDGQPIWSRFPWSDSDQVDVVARRIREAVGGSTYQGLPIGRPGGFVLTDQVERGAKRHMFVTAWSHGFPDDPREARRRLLAGMLGWSPTGEGPAVSSQVLTPLSLLPDRPATPRLPGAPAPMVPRALRPRPFLLSRLQPLRPEGVKSSSYAWDALARAGREMWPADLRRSLDRWLAHTPLLDLASSPAFEDLIASPTAPDPHAVHRAVLRHFGAEVPERYLTDSEASMPRPLVDTPTFHCARGLARHGAAP